jgi:hypothetical protein
MFWDNICGEDKPHIRGADTMGDMCAGNRSDNPAPSFPSEPKARFLIDNWLWADSVCNRSHKDNR